MITHKHKLDMVPGGAVTIVNVSQYDDKFTIAFELFARTGVLNLSSVADAEIRGTKSDGNAYSATVTVSNGIATVTGDVQLTAVAGRQIFEITLYDSNEDEVSSANFILNVERAPMDKDTIPSESVIRELLDVADRAEEIVQAASDAEAYSAGTRDGDPVTSGDPAYENNAPYYLDEVKDAKTDALNDISAARAGALEDIEDTLENLATIFSAASSYVKGEYVLYNGVLYEFTADHAAGAWTGTDAIQVKICDELTGLNRKFGSLGFSVVNGALNVTYTV